MTTMLVNEVLKERALSYLKRVAEIANGATKTAVMSFGALAIIWFTEFRPQYQQLLSVYGQYQDFYGQMTANSKEQKSLRNKLRDARQDTKKNTNQASLGTSPVAAAYVTKLQETFDKKGKQS